LVLLHFHHIDNGNFYNDFLPGQALGDLFATNDGNPDKIEGCFDSSSELHDNMNLIDRIDQLEQVHDVTTDGCHGHQCRLLALPH